MKQCVAWERAGAVVFARTLRYPWDYGTNPSARPQEKGIDVQLCVDFVAGAIEDAYDVGIICSTDTDLRPAVEYVVHKYANYPRAEVMAWKSPTANRSIATHASRGIWCHYLDFTDYQMVEDAHDYNT